MQDALNEFRGTSEEIRVLISNAELALLRGDVDSALSSLRSVEPNKPYVL